MVPKIILNYSTIYDAMLFHFSTGRYKHLNDTLFINREKFVESKINVLKGWWNQQGLKILKVIASVSGFQWDKKEIIIYFLAEPHRKSWVGGFSDPLTIFLRKKIKGKLISQDIRFLKLIIIHELVHQILPKNKIIEKYFDKLQLKYQSDRITATHILIYSILENVYKLILSEKEIGYDKMRSREHKSYFASWKIVEKEGSNKIINDFRRFLVNYKNN
ncbi:MAG: hypothetical protein KKF56_03065 [Nanoarchaeota archaeon]|nr:hypothetical protein [Nanoarchaeota archaeon]